MKPKTTSAQRELERAAEKRKKQHYVLKLYVSGATPRSTVAIKNIRKICEDHLEGRYDLEVVDIYQQRTLAEGEQILAAPTLVKQIPLPLRRFIGDMSNTEHILLGLDLKIADKKITPASPAGTPP